MVVLLCVAACWRSLVRVVGCCWLCVGVCRVLCVLMCLVRWGLLVRVLQRVAGCCCSFVCGWLLFVEARCVLLLCGVWCLLVSLCVVRCVLCVVGGCVVCCVKCVDCCWLL